jgi:putative MFS transporter
MSMAQPAGGQDIKVVERLERLPITAWQVKARVIVGIATFFDAFDALTIAYVLPVLIPLFKMTPQDVGFLISSSYVGQIIGALFFGWIAERYGRMPAMIGSIALFALMSIACALATDYNTFFIFRFIQGIGLGGEVPVAATFIIELTGAKKRGRFLLLYELIFPVGLVAAALAGRLMVPTWGWQSMFYVGAIPAIIALVLRFVLPESPRWLASRGRMAEADQALKRIEAGVESAYGKPLPPPVPQPPATVQPPSWRDVFAGVYLSRTLMIWALWFCSYFIGYGLSTWLPTMYTQLMKTPLTTALNYALIAQCISFIGSLTCALVIDRVGRRNWVMIAFGGGVVGFSIMWLTGTPTPEHVLIMGAATAMFVSTNSLALYVYTPELYPTRVRALAVSAATAWLRLASAIAPIAVGYLIGNQYGIPSVWLMFAIVAVIGIIITALFAIETKERVLEEISK